MRIIERVLYISAVLFIITRYQTKYCYLFLMNFFIFVRIAKNYEGLRFAEFPCIASCFIHFIFGEFLRYDFTIYIFGLGTFLSIICILFYGEINFEPLGQHSGKCGVGT